MQDYLHSIMRGGVEKAQQTRHYLAELGKEFAKGVSLDTPRICVVEKKHR